MQQETVGADELQIIRDLLASIRFRPPGGQWQFIWNNSGIPFAGGIGFTFYIDYRLLTRAAIQAIRSLSNQLAGHSVGEVHKILKDFFYNNLQYLDRDRLFHGSTMTSENTLEITPEPIQLHLASELSTYISSQLNNSLYLVPALGITAPESIITEDVIWTSGDADLNIELSPIFETDENLLGCQFPPVRTDTRTVTLGNEDSILGCIASLDLDADEKIKRTVGALSMALELPSSRQFTAADSPRGLFSIDQDGSWTMRGWPPAVPRLGPQIRTTPDMARMIRALLVDYVHDDTLHRRIQIALEYIEAGWKPLGRLGFLHNAIAIDALFGIQGQVRISIENGLAHYASEVNNIHRRANLLWRLRNELTHGASQRLELSPVYLTYYDEFGVDPALDQINILRTCLWNLAEAI